MWIRRSLTLFAVLVAVLTCGVHGAHAELYSRDALRVLARARAATGGAGWNILRGVHEVGVVGGVRYERWIDPLRYGSRLETRERAGLRVHGFNGVADWQILPDGRLTGADDRATQAEARTDAFFATQGYFYSGRFDARGVHLGVRRADGRTYDALMIQPKGGKPRELWFDRRTRLLGRIIDRNGAQPVVLEVSDYRKIGPVLVAHKYTAPAAALSRAQDRVIESVDFKPASRDRFSLPLADVAAARR